MGLGVLFPYMCKSDFKSPNPILNPRTTLMTIMVITAAILGIVIRRLKAPCRRFSRLLHMTIGPRLVLLIIASLGGVDASLMDQIGRHRIHAVRARSSH